MNRDNVKMLILDSGEHMIGEVVGGDDKFESFVRMKNPVTIVPDPTNRGQLMFIPYLQLCEEDVCIFSIYRHLLTPKEQLINNYVEQFSGIAVPPSNLVLG